MCRRLLAGFMCALLIFLTGCSDTKRIDKASLAEAVTVTENEGKVIYTFFLLGSGEEPEKAEIPAESFEEACTLAKQGYIPNLSLAKLELYVLDRDLYEEKLGNDLEFMSGEYLVSPDMYVVLADKATMQIMENSKDAKQKTEDYIVTLKKENPQININLLSIFNNFFSGEAQEFYVSYINCERGMTASKLKISAQK